MKKTCEKSSKKKAQSSQGQNVRLSRTLSYLLRHGALDAGLHMDSAGYVSLHELLRHKSLRNVSIQDIELVVEKNDKKRFSLKKDNATETIWIRANQGHSIRKVSTEELLEEITDPGSIPVCVHGTYWKYWGSIQEQGLKKMNRNHIHFAMGQNAISGMRKSSELKIFIDTPLAMRDGLKFYRSANGVILSPGFDGTISPKYFIRVCSTDGREVMPNSVDDGTRRVV